MMRFGLSAARPDTSPHVHVESCSGAGFHQFGTASYSPFLSSPPFLFWLSNTIGTAIIRAMTRHTLARRIDCFVSMTRDYETSRALPQCNRASSLVAQSDDRIDFHGAPRRDETRDQGNQTQESRGQHECQRFSRTQGEQ